MQDSEYQKRDGGAETIDHRDDNKSQERAIETGYLQPGMSLPLVVRPAASDVDLVLWSINNRQFIKAKLFEHGAILFRDFKVDSPDDFRRFVREVSGELIEYRERTSPRSEVGDRIYTATDYPADQGIFLHNENSYALTYPMKLFFFCDTPAEQGGETLIADCRKIFQCISPEIRDRFAQRKWMYVRNFGDGFGLDWQTVFQTADSIEVEQYCRRAGVDCEWKDADRLRTRQVRPAVARHPQTGEMVWFNHATFFHVSTLEPAMREILLDEFEEEDLPNNTFYGDGSRFEPSVLDEVRRAYLNEIVPVVWQNGDIVMLDNMLVAHGRAPFIGARKILFAMTEPFTREDI